MRIIGGIAGGRRLKVPKGLAVRPTPDLVKQALFNSLGGRVCGARVLELFAGSGALGLECLSRGAARVVAVEVNARHAAIVRENIRDIGLPADRFELRTQDVYAALTQLRAMREAFDLILADPPFGEKNVGRRSHSCSQRLLDHPALPHLLGADGIFALGHASRDTLSLPPVWIETKALRHGDSMFRLLRPDAGSPSGPTDQPAPSTYNPNE